MDTTQIASEAVLSNQGNQYDSPHVLVDVAGLIYAVPCNYVLSLEQLNVVTPIPTSFPEVRGVVKFRGKIIELLNTRVLFNSKTIDEDVNNFFALMDAKLEDQLNWFKNLEECVENGKEFVLANDSNQSEFAKWYDKFKDTMTTHDATLVLEVAKFDKPYKAVYKAGVDALNMTRRGNKEGAIKLIQETKSNELKELISIFSSVKETYSNSKKEIMLVLGKTEQEAISLAVDEVVAIEHIFEVDEALLSETTTNTDYIKAVAKRKNNTVIFVLNSEAILGNYSKKSYVSE